ncbi:MAG: DUF2924 domain-containing protein [Pseudolabrys sp.]|nr:DUF2924 domain-containing protein [Pseudolabrys sp.]
MGRVNTRPKRQQPSLNDEIAHLRDLDLKGLRTRWKGIFRGQPPDHLPRHLLVGMLAYRMQAQVHGDLDATTNRLLKQIGSGGANIDAVGLTVEHERRRASLKPGTILMREWNGQPQRVTIIDAGFSWKGKTYDSLSKIAFAITGTKWNGPRFFGLRDKPNVEAQL